MASGYSSLIITLINNTQEQSLKATIHRRWIQLNAFRNQPGLNKWIRNQWIPAIQEVVLLKSETKKKNKNRQ
jgi:hypothetical protein